MRHALTADICGRRYDKSTPGTAARRDLPFSGLHVTQAVGACAGARRDSLCHALNNDARNALIFNELQKVIFRTAKDNLLHDKRQPFALQKAAFCFLSVIMPCPFCCRLMQRSPHFSYCQVKLLGQPERAFAPQQGCRQAENGALGLVVEQGVGLAEV